MTHATAAALPLGQRRDQSTCFSAPVGLNTKHGPKGVDHRFSPAPGRPASNSTINTQHHTALLFYGKGQVVWLGCSC
jgi:hypothetical protein